MKISIQTSILLFLLAAGNATASIVRYDCAETNGSFTVDCGVGESQFMTTVSDNGGSSATFRFQNLGSTMSIISQIYFDDTAASLLDFSTVVLDDVDNGPINNIGVDFSNAAGPISATPADMPGAIPFDVSYSLGRDSRGGISRGINNATAEPVITYEMLEVTANYLGNASFDLLTAALDSGEFKLGLKAQSFPDGGSEWFTSTTTTVVPVPAAFWLFGTALIGFIKVSRKTRL